MLGQLVNANHARILRHHVQKFSASGRLSRCGAVGRRGAEPGSHPLKQTSTNSKIGCIKNASRRGVGQQVGAPRVVLGGLARADDAALDAGVTHSLQAGSPES